jgi:heme/copper-type cytochrome/quinol oxidase subunit 3
MSRRRRRRGRSRTPGPKNKWLLVVQIFVMAGVLIFLFLFWDYIAGGASDAVETVTGTGDLKVQEAKEDPSDGE